MALDKELILDNGFAAGYWKIISFRFSVVLELITIEIALYKDREWRLRSPEHYVERRSINVSARKMLENQKEIPLIDVLPHLYRLIKEPAVPRLQFCIDPAVAEHQTINWFSDAKDVFEE
jgi:hypothetical protein